MTPGFPPAQGGVESHTGALVRELAAAGVDVRVLTARRGLRRAVDEVCDGVPVRVYPAWRQIGTSTGRVASGERGVAPTPRTSRKATAVSSSPPRGGRS